ncbi:MAG TPA: hypothetical protein VKD72_20280 [Gemmataceae bacterium]|nr:hypothetical protein [Gemmataceae bacterium]
MAWTRLRSHQLQCLKRWWRMRQYGSQAASVALIVCVCLAARARSAPPGLLSLADSIQHADNSHRVLPRGLRFFPTISGVPGHEVSPLLQAAQADECPRAPDAFARIGGPPPCA